MIPILKRGETEAQRGECVVQGYTFRNRGGQDWKACGLLWAPGLDPTLHSSHRGSLSSEQRPRKFSVNGSSFLRGQRQTADRDFRPVR